MHDEQTYTATLTGCGQSEQKMEATGEGERRERADAEHRIDGFLNVGLLEHCIDVLLEHCNAALLEHCLLVLLEHALPARHGGICPGGQGRGQAGQHGRSGEEQDSGRKRHHSQISGKDGRSPGDGRRWDGPTHPRRGEAPVCLRDAQAIVDRCCGLVCRRCGNRIRIELAPDKPTSTATRPPIRDILYRIWRRGRYLPNHRFRSVIDSCGHAPACFCDVPAVLQGVPDASELDILRWLRKAWSWRPGDAYSELFCRRCGNLIDDRMRLAEPPSTAIRTPIPDRLHLVWMRGRHALRTRLLDPKTIAFHHSRSKDRPVSNGCASYGYPFRHVSPEVEDASWISRWPPPSHPIHPAMCSPQAPAHIEDEERRAWERIMAKAERGLHCTRIQCGLPVTAEERLSVHLASERRFHPLITARGERGYGAPVFASNWKEVVEGWIDCAVGCQMQQLVRETEKWHRRQAETIDWWEQRWGVGRGTGWEGICKKHAEQLHREIEEWLMRGQKTREQWEQRWGVESGAGCVEIYKKHREQLHREAAERDVRQPKTRKQWEQWEQHWVAMYGRHKEELRRETAEWRMLEQKTREQAEIYMKREQQLRRDMMRQWEIRKQWEQRWGVEREERAGWVEICKKHAHCVYHEWEGLLAPGGGTGVPKLITRSLKHGLMPHKDAMAWMLAWKAASSCASSRYFPGHFADGYAERWINKPWGNLWNDDDWNTADAVGEGHVCNDGCGRRCPGHEIVQEKYNMWLSSWVAVPWCRERHLEMSCPVQYPAPCTYRQEAADHLLWVLVKKNRLPVEVVEKICEYTMLLGFSQYNDSDSSCADDLGSLSSDGEREEGEGEFLSWVGEQESSSSSSQAMHLVNQIFWNMSIATDGASSGSDDEEIRGSRGGTELKFVQWS